MTQIADAPYIREAEMYGADGRRTQKELDSMAQSEKIMVQLRTATNLIRMAKGIFEGLPEETVWEEKITELADDAANLAQCAEDLKCEIGRW